MLRRTRILLAAILVVALSSCATRPSLFAVKEELTHLASGTVAPAYQPAGSHLLSAAKDCPSLAAGDCLNLDFARRMMADPASRSVQRRFAARVHHLASEPASALAELRRAAESYVVLFAPGWLYRSRPASGASFEEQRRLLAALGIKVLLIETAESATVEHNAAVIAETLRRRPDSAGERRLLVSTSKAGPEVALALGKLLERDEIETVDAWINIGGVLRGSPAADAVLASWFRPMLRLHFALRGFDWSGFRSLATDPRRRSFDALHFPSQLRIVNYVAVPLSEDLHSPSDIVRRAMPDSRANDGITLLDDAIVPGAYTVIQPGTDHYFKLPDVDDRALALLATVLELVADSRGSDTPIAVSSGNS